MDVACADVMGDKHVLMHQVCEYQQDIVLP